MRPSAQSLVSLEDGMALSRTHCSMNCVHQCLPKWQQRTTWQNNCATFCWVSHTCCNRCACAARPSRPTTAVDRQGWRQEGRSRSLEGSFLSPLVTWRPLILHTVLLARHAMYSSVLNPLHCSFQWHHFMLNSTQSLSTRFFNPDDHHSCRFHRGSYKHPLSWSVKPVLICACECWYFCFNFVVFWHIGSPLVNFLDQPLWCLRFSSFTVTPVVAQQHV